jgi:hypothetical protein
VKGVAANLCAGSLTIAAGSLERRSSDETVRLSALQDEIAAFGKELQSCLEVLPQLREKLQKSGCMDAMTI